MGRVIDSSQEEYSTCSKESLVITIDFKIVFYILFINLPKKCDEFYTAELFMFCTHTDYILFNILCIHFASDVEITEKRINKIIHF